MNTPDKLIELFRKEINLELLRAAIEEGFDVNHRDQIGMTLLHVICNGNYDDVTCSKAVQLIADNNGNLDSIDDLGWTPLTLAICTNKPITSETLLFAGALAGRVSSSCIESPLMVAIKLHMNELATNLINVGADIDEIDDGETPYSIAKMSDNEYMRGYLAALGARYFIPDSDESTSDFTDCSDVSSSFSSVSDVGDEWIQAR